MPDAKIQFVYDQKNSSSFANKKGTVFVKGELPRLYRSIREYDKKIKADSAHQYRHCGALLISGSSESKVIPLVESQDKSNTFVICFSGTKLDYESICEKYSKQSNVLVLRMILGVRYVLEFSWGHSKSPSGFHCKASLISTEKFVEKIEKPVKKEEKKNVNVSVQKSNIDKKTNK